MSRDKRKDLRLVKPEPPTETEVDRAQRALEAAADPAGLDAADHEAILAMTLGEDAAAIDDDERASAEALRDALEQPEPRHPLAELAGALRAADRAGMTDLEPADHEALVEQALDGEEAAQAAALRRALERGDRGHPLVELAGALRAAEGRGPALQRADHDALLALGLDDVREVDADAAALREALDGEGSHPLADWAEAARLAHRPEALDSRDAEALLGLSLGVEAEVDARSRQEAAALGEALAGRAEHPLARWSTALRAAGGKLAGIDQMSHERIVRRVVRRAPSRRGVVVGAIVAAAAAAALLVGSAGWLEPTRPASGPTAARAVPQAEMVAPRSTESLFEPEPFAVRGGETDRVGRIVEARAADLRENRFASWGVR